MRVSKYWFTNKLSQLSTKSSINRGNNKHFAIKISSPDSSIWVYPESPSWPPNAPTSRMATTKTAALDHRSPTDASRFDSKLEPFCELDILRVDAFYKLVNRRVDRKPSFIGKHLHTHKNIHTHTVATRCMTYKNKAPAANHTHIKNCTNSNNITHV